MHSTGWDVLVGTSFDIQRYMIFFQTQADFTYNLNTGLEIILKVTTIRALQYEMESCFGLILAKIKFAVNF